MDRTTRDGLELLVPKTSLIKVPEGFFVCNPVEAQNVLSGARDAMPALFDLLEKETVASVRAVLGHWLFGYIHPYPDGNGRMARFVMNVMLASGGHPWTVIRVQDRDAYLAALESASIDKDIETFARFLAEQVARSLEQMV